MNYLCSKRCSKKSLHASKITNFYFVSDMFTCDFGSHLPYTTEMNEKEDQNADKIT